MHALSLGVLAYAPFRPQYAEVGIRTGFAAAIFGGLAAVAFPGMSLPATGPRAATSPILAGFVATLAADPGLGIGDVVALASAFVALAGLLQIAFDALGLGTFAEFVPFLVMGGFKRGVAILIAPNRLPQVPGALSAVLRE